MYIYTIYMLRRFLL